jgi:hypothetical protein
MSQIGYIFLGWLLGIFSMLITLWVQARTERQKKEIEILSETLKYLFRTKQAYNNLLTDKSVLDKACKEYPQKTSELERQMYENFDKNIKEEFFPELMFHSFQLKRLYDKSFLRDFDIVMNKFEELGNKIMEQSSNDVISDINTETLELMKVFVEKCNAKAKL